MIKDLGVGYGVFVKAQVPHYIKENVLVNIGESYIILDLIPNETGGETLEEPRILSQNSHSGHMR